MKKIILGLVTTCLSLTFSQEAMAGNANSAKSTEKSTNAAKAQVMVNRLNEIKALDISKLNAGEKKELRNEVLSMKKQLMVHDPVLFISGGALLLIIILLIILL